MLNIVQDNKNKKIKNEKQSNKSEVGTVLLALVFSFAALLLGYAACGTAQQL